MLLLLPGWALAGQDVVVDQSPANAVPRPPDTRLRAATQRIAPHPLGSRAGGLLAPSSMAGATGRYAADPSGMCEFAVAAAEISSRLPARLLAAISVTESGRIDPRTGAVRPWPWTINAEGQGQFFATRQQAITAVSALRARGVQSIDVGCMQVNLMYHPNAFASLAEAFDPGSNARYAARFLISLHDGNQDWRAAIAAYHSDTPALGDAYRVSVLARWQNPSLREAVPQNGAYRDFVNDGEVYAAFAPNGRVYGAFTMGTANH